MSGVTIKLGAVGTVRKHFFPLVDLTANRGWTSGTTGETVPSLKVDTSVLVYVGGTAYGDVELTLDIYMLIRDDMDSCRTAAVIRHENLHVKDAERIFRSFDRKLKSDAAFKRLFETSVTNVTAHRRSIENRARDLFRQLTDAAAKQRDRHSTAYMKKSDRQCTLKPGMTGSEVKLLKTLLNKGMPLMAPLPITSKYDTATKDRLILFKDAYAIPSRPGDSRAVVDRKTWEYLDIFK